MFNILLKLAAFIGLTGLVICIVVVGTYTHPAISLSLILWNSLAAYILIIILLMTGSTLIEFLIIIGMITVILLTALFATNDALSDNIQLLAWSLLCAAWYMPVFVLSLGALFNTDEASSEPVQTEADHEAASERQNLIDKSLKRRKRKLDKRHKD